ncbi:hypothetical protein [Lactococcus lactis]|uniref:hypothetical protein n=1 Tax=Lactococcus lactis TaxID=1358 RepID=UPI00071C2E09|nr:hypothetical protein [Lactococcus lactis]
MGKKNQLDLFESVYGTIDISDDEWYIIRTNLRTLFKRSRRARRSSQVSLALQEIKRSDDRMLFEKHFIQGQKIDKIAIDNYYDESTVRTYIHRATKEFAAAYCDGLLIKPFVE